MVTTELTTQTTSVSDRRSLAADFARSNYFQDAKEAAQAIVKIQAGYELGFGPVYSMTHIYIVKGKVMVSAEALGAKVKGSGRYDYTVKRLDDDECILLFTDNGKEAYTSKFTKEDAKRADLVRQDSGWLKWPRAMLMSKALSQGARIVCPHVIAGVYTPADFAVETTEQGEPLKSEVIVKVEPPAAPAAPKEIKPFFNAEDYGLTEDNEPEDKMEALTMCTSDERKYLFATAEDMGYSHQDVADVLHTRYHQEHTSDLTRAELLEFV